MVPGNGENEIIMEIHYCRTHNIRLVTIYGNGFTEEVCPICTKLVIYEPFEDLQKETY